MNNCNNDKNNGHIKKYLDYYVQLKHPGYAVLLKGSWGVGKTKFIIDNISSKYLYVSLNGIDSIEALNAVFMEVLISNKVRDISSANLISSNIKNSKFVKNLGILFKKIISFKYIKCFMSKCKKIITYIKPGKIPKHIITAGLGIFNIKIRPDQILEFTSLSENTVIIFDDIERSLIDIKSIFGFINRFVEHDSLPVIIIYNEEQIFKEKPDVYSEIKEKIIGAEFTITPEVDLALDSFIVQIKNPDLKKFFLDCDIYKYIVDIFEKSNCENLRLLKMSLIELDRVTSMIPNCLSFDEEEFWIKVIIIFEILFLETKSGKLSKAQIISPSLINSLINDTEKNDEKENNDALKKYIPYITYDLFLPDDFWKRLLCDGALDKNIINTKIEEFYRKTPKEYLALQDLRRYFKLSSENEFLEALKTVEDSIQNKKYNDPQAIMKIMDIFLELNSEGFSIDQKYLTATFFIKYIQDNNCIKYDNLDFNNDRFTSPDSFFGQEYWRSEDKEFKKLDGFIQKETQKYKTDFFKEKAKQMEQSPKKCLEFLAQNSKGENRSFTYFPVMQYVDAYIFINNLITLLSEDTYSILGYIISRRSFFDSEKNNPFYVKEVKWTDKLKEKLDQKIKDSNLSTFEKTKLQIAVRAAYKKR